VCAEVLELSSVNSGQRLHDAQRMSAKQIVLMDARAIERTLRRMADEIVEVNAGTESLVMVGIQRRGVQLAERLVRIITEREGVQPPLGSLDITLYRDDLQTVGPRPVVGRTDLPWNLEGRRLVIVDDVLFTGRTIRAALDELTDFGRAARIELAVLVDRGGRELPIHADFVGKRIEATPEQRVDVLVEELDGRDAVILASRTEPIPR
jgi:pyrimidine operon attenuation protein/uracil phosphoribosyltransferase